MTTSAPAPVSSVSSTLGKPVTIGATPMFIRRAPSAGLALFTVTLVLEHDERAEADFAIENGRVVLFSVQAGIIRPFGGGEQGHAALQAALQSALKVPAPALVSPELVEFNAAREACRVNRTPANCARWIRAWCAYHRSIAR